MKKDTSGNNPAQSFPWETLTWEDLSEWTDSRSLERGRSYHRRGAVRNLNLLPDGGLLANVVGTQQYTTHVSVTGQSGDLRQRMVSACSCPVVHRCKHGVAVILAYLHAVESGTHVSETDGDDRRLALIENGWEEELSDVEFDDEGIQDTEVDGVDTSAMKGSGMSTTHRSASPKKSSSNKQTSSRRKITDSDIVEFLQAKSKDDLVTIIMQACRDDAKLRQIYVDRIMLETGDHAAMIREAQKELRSVTSKEAWYNSWEGRGSLPDYSRLQSQLRSLVDAEQFDSVVQLGRELIERGIQQVGQSHDDGATAFQIMTTLSIIAEAIVPCSLTDVEKILFVIDSFLEDDYGLCDAFGQVLDRRFSKSVWTEVAESLKLRLPSQVVDKKDRISDDFTRRYQRERLTGWILRALEASGDEVAATNFCIDEATKAGSYQRAVDRLIAMKRYDEAKALASQGLEKTDPTYFGLIHRLQDSLATIASKNNDHSVAAAVAAERFVARPDVSSLQDLLQAAKKAKCEAATKAVAMHFLETGESPSFTNGSKPQTKKTKKVESSQMNCWPFLAPPRPLAGSHRGVAGQADVPSPHFDVLIQLAIQQRDPEAVLRWYDESQASQTRYPFRFNFFEAQVADAVSSTHPDRAIELYCKEADQLAAETNPKLYPQSVSLLKKARQVLKANQREDEFEGILADFHNRHRRKSRLVQLLHNLGGQPIIRKNRRDS